MKKIKKKITLGLFASSLVLGPLVIAVSCGTTPETPWKKISNSTNLPVDWTPIVPSILIDNEYKGNFSTVQKKQQFMSINTNVDDNDFGSEPGLTSITLRRVLKIGKSAFTNSPLTTISLPNVEEVDDYAFTNAQLGSIELPNATKIGIASFAESNATNIDISKAETIGNSAFQTAAITTLNVENATTIGSSTFLHAQLAGVSLLQATSVGTKAFETSPLTSLQIPELTFGAIGIDAFKNIQPHAMVFVKNINDWKDRTDLATVFGVNSDSIQWQTYT